MASINASAPGTRQIENALRRGAKTTLVDNGIEPSTRRGNKELTLAVQRLAQQTYSTIEEATQTGEALGQKIVELSQAKGKTDLDGGIVRQMMLTGEIPTVVKVTAKPAKTTPVAVTPEPKATDPAPAKPPTPEAKKADEVKGAAVIKESTEVEVPSAAAIADLEDEGLETADIGAMTTDVDVVTDEVDGVEAMETVDAEMADAPDLAAIEMLEPEAIEAPTPEPLTSAETATMVESTPAMTEPEVVEENQ